MYRPRHWHSFSIHNVSLGGIGVPENSGGKPKLRLEVTEVTYVKDE